MRNLRRVALIVIAAMYVAAIIGFAGRTIGPLEFGGLTLIAILAALNAKADVSKKMTHG